MSALPTLVDLVHPLSVDDFINQHWEPEAPLLSRASEQLMSGLQQIPGLQNVSELLARHQREVLLFGPNAFRSQVSPKSALDFLPRGFNVYVTHVEQTLPQAHAFVLGIAQDLGVAPWDVHLEAFAGTKDAVSSRHYDHDVNFQILLEGEKAWQIEGNRNIRNPMSAYHPQRDPRGRPFPFPEEIDADDANIGATFDASRSQHHRTQAGSVLFVPRAWWHEVTSLSSTWGINIVLKGSTFAACVAEALSARLHRKAEFRAFLGGLPLRAGQSAQQSQAATLAALKLAAIEEIMAISLEEASLSAVHQLFQFPVASDGRRIVDGTPPSMEVPGVLAAPIRLDADVAATLRVLFAFKHTFTWDHALAATRYGTPIGLYNLLQQLVGMGILARA